MKKISFLAVLILLVGVSAYPWPWGGGGGGGGAGDNITITNSPTTTLPWDNITSRPTINLVTVTGAVLDNVSNYPASLVRGPASATDSYFVYFDGTSGKLLKDGQSTVNPAFSTINVYGANALNVGTGSSIKGTIRFKNATNGNYFEIGGGVAGANIGWTLPTAAPAGENYILRSSTAGVLSYVDPATLGGVTGATSNRGLVATTTTLGLIETCSDNQVLKWTGSAWACAADATGDIGSGIANVVEDTTPQLGGTLDLNGNGIDNVSQVEMEYLNGVTSGIQGQLNAKAPIASPTFTGTVTAPKVVVAGTGGGTIDNTVIGGTTALAGSFTTLVATTLNTGQGAYELYAMDQNVRTTDNVTFNTVSATEFISTAADNTRGVTVPNTADPTGANLAAGKGWFNITSNLLKWRNGDNSATLSYMNTGTLTDTKTCIYTSGTGIVCNTTPTVYFATDGSFNIGTTSMAINRASATQTLAGIDLTAPNMTGTITTGTAGTAASMEFRDTDVTHGITTVANTNAFFQIAEKSATDGGVNISGFSDAAGTGAVEIRGYMVQDPTDTVAAITLDGYTANGTGAQELGAAETILKVSNADSAKITVLGNGNTTFAGTVTANMGASSTATTKSAWDNSTALATTRYVDTEYRYQRFTIDAPATTDNIIIMGPIDWGNGLTIDNVVVVIQDNTGKLSTAATDNVTFQIQYATSSAFGTPTDVYGSAPVATGAADYSGALTANTPPANGYVRIVISAVNNMTNKKMYVRIKYHRT